MCLDQRSVKISVGLFYSFHMVDLLICYSKYLDIKILLRLFKLPKVFCVQFIIISLLSFNLGFP